MVGKTNDSTITIDGQPIRALTDTGSDISTMSDKCFNLMDPRPKLRNMSDFNLNITGASGASIPYIGYFEAEVCLPGSEHEPAIVPILVVPVTKYSGQVPVIVGTNIIGELKVHAQQTDIDIPTAWNTAFAAFTATDSKFVKSTNKKPIVAHPNQVVTINGLVRDTSNYENAVTENLEDNHVFNVCPRIVAVKSNSKTARVPVRVCNISARPITIKPKSQLCSLQEVNVIKTMNPSCNSVSVEGSPKSFEDLGIHLPKDNLSSGELNEASELLGKWKHIFSTGPTDLGFTDLVKHEINLTDETPFKEPYRRIPPALFEEVREHLKEMLDAGAIRESQSPFSSNVVLVRKKDGSLRFCIDYRKLNNRTVKDAYYLPRIEETIDTLSGSKYFSKLDLRSGYWQVGVKESDKMKTAFSVGPLGFFECNRMAFSLCNAPASFQRLMERCMGELHLRECLIYLEDISILVRHSKSI